VSSLASVVEFTDPGCVWSWSSEPKLRRLRDRYGPALYWRRVFGLPTQVQDSPEAVLAEWAEVAALTGAPLTARLEWVARSSLLAARAARAAEHQGTARAEAVLRRLREAYFLDGRPPDTLQRIAAAVAGVPRLDIARLLRDLDSPDVVWSVDAGAAVARRPRPEVIGLAGVGAAVADGDDLRYTFPTLLIRGPCGERVVPGWREYDEYAAAIEAVAPGVAVAA
jgi:predicted DsbA family dithiol-disulfide isomerase